jgi:tetratricopeptide (TPR) repeat protein
MHFVFLAIGIACIAVFYPESSRRAQAQPFLAPPKDLARFTFGYQENLADSLWLRLIQDLDHCDTAQLSDGQTPKKLCDIDRGWVFQMLDGITTIAPKFRAPYAFGATALSVLVNDREGAKVIFDRALVQFPNDWSLEYKAAYHYLYEMKDQKKAADLLIQAGKNGAPGWVYSLAAQLYTAEGQARLAKSVLEGVINEDPDARFAPRLRERLQEIDKVLAGTKQEQKAQ